MTAKKSISTTKKRIKKITPPIEKIINPKVNEEKIEEYIKIFEDIKRYEPIKYSLNWFAIRQYINNIKFIGMIKKERYKVYKLCSWKEFKTKNKYTLENLWVEYCNWFNDTFNKSKEVK